jgi:hypothetical protein
VVLAQINLDIHENINLNHHQAHYTHRSNKHKKVDAMAAEVRSLSTAFKEIKNAKYRFRPCRRFYN